MYIPRPLLSAFRERFLHCEVISAILLASTRRHLPRTDVQGVEVPVHGVRRAALRASIRRIEQEIGPTCSVPGRQPLNIGVTRNLHAVDPSSVCAVACPRRRLRTEHHLQEVPIPIAENRSRIRRRLRGHNAGLAARALQKQTHGILRRTDEPGRSDDVILSRPLAIPCLFCPRLVQLDARIVGVGPVRRKADLHALVVPTGSR